MPDTGMSSSLGVLVVERGAIPMPTNLAQLLTETASRHGDRPALKLEGSVLTYDTLNEAATRVPAC